MISKNAIEVDFAISSGIYRFLYLKSGLGVDLLFVVVADKKAIDVLSRRDDDLYALIEYAEKNGTTEIAQSAANRFTIGFSNDSVFEDEFYKTISHYCTIQGARFERNVKLTDVFPEERNNSAVSKKEC